MAEETKRARKLDHVDSKAISQGLLTVRSCGVLLRHVFAEDYQSARNTATLNFNWSTSLAQPEKEDNNFGHLSDHDLVALMYALFGFSV